MKLLIPALAAFALTTAAQVASAGCNIEVTFKNKASGPVVVKKADSKVRLEPAGPWKTFMNADVTVPKNGEVKKAYELELPCVAGPRKFKFYYVRGQNTGWENKGPVLVSIDKKVKVVFKD